MKSINHQKFPFETQNALELTAKIDMKGLCSFPGIIRFIHCVDKGLEYSSY